MTIHVFYAGLYHSSVADGVAMRKGRVDGSIPGDALLYSDHPNSSFWPMGWYTTDGCPRLESDVPKTARLSLLLIL